MIKNIKNIKKTQLFQKITQKDEEYKQFLMSRIASHIDKKTAKNMIDFAMSKKEFNKQLDILEDDCFKGKSPSKTPTIHLVIAQAGSGKSCVSKILSAQNPDAILIDTDNYKKYHPLASILLKNCPSHYGTLTGLDGYLQRDKIYDKAISNHFDIIIEITPSSKNLLFNVDFSNLLNNEYKIICHVLAVCKANSLLSVHKRYEKQLASNHPSPKLSDFDRALDSTTAIKQVVDTLSTLDFVTTKLYKRHKDEAVEIKTLKNQLQKTYRQERENDFLRTKDNLNNEILEIKKQMKKRHAPRCQKQQLKKTIKHIKKNQI